MPTRRLKGAERRPGASEAGIVLRPRGARHPGWRRGTVWGTASPGEDPGKSTRVFFSRYMCLIIIELYNIQLLF